MPLVHHELCFGCGRTNLFGLLAELERQPDGSVSGRCFIKQDHQGETVGAAHGGILAAALLEAMSHVAGPRGLLTAVELSFEGAVAIGEFVELEARAGGEEVVAEARSHGAVVARARGAVKEAARG